MHYYQFNIGDYAKRTRHLSNLEDLAYRRLIDLYYTTEKPFQNDVKQIARLIGMRDNIEEIEQVLADFFILNNDEWMNKRADEEIVNYREKADTARANGKKGGRPKKPNPNPEITQLVNLANPAITGLQANQEPLTINQEPITIYIPFDSFWNLYPKKVDKKPTSAKWKTLKVTEEIFTKIKKHLEIAYNQTDKQFIPSPKVYLGNEKWNDEVIANGNQQQAINKPGRAFGE